MKAKTKRPKKLPYYSCPSDMTLRDWQIGLRKQFVIDRDFEVFKNGDEAVWSDYIVKNPKYNSQYRVALRSQEIGLNYCTCGDFKTNTLGTCKHIEAVLQFVQNKRGFKKHLKTPYNPSHSSVFLQYGREQKICVRFGTDAPAKLVKGLSQFIDSDSCYLTSKINQFPKFLKKLRASDHHFKLKEDVLQYIVDARELEYRKTIIRKHKRKWKSYFDSILKIRPYRYQSDGIWKAVECGRCLIADEMGLGKTIQAIAAAAILTKELNIKKVVIVCPTSLKYQWKSEIEKFTDLSVSVVEGNKLKRREVYQQNNDLFNIISHHLAFYDVDELIALKPDLIILDEAQRIKNWSTKISRSIKRIPSRYAFVLTGTPLENKIEELYSILQFTNPYILPPVFEFLDRHRIIDESGKVIGYKNMHEIRAQLEPIMVRRKKEEVLSELPLRTIQNIFLAPTKEQIELHEEYAYSLSKIVHKWRQYGFLSEEDRLRMMSLMQKMRMVSDSTYLIDQITKRYDTKVDEINNLLNEILQSPGNKVVIFSEWLNMHSLIIETLEERDIDFEFLNGSVSSVKRGKMVARFQDDPACRVFLSTDAGGTGLNLQAASHLINVDLPWNPAKLEQRMARIHRIGQKKHVQIINLISLDTIEYKMLDRLNFKANMAAGILDDGEDAIFMDDQSMKAFINSIEPIMDAQSQADNQSINRVEDVEPLPIESGKSIEEKLFEEVTHDEHVKDSSEHEGRNETTALIESGIQFFAQVVQTLQDEKKTDRLVKQFVKKEGDKTFIQIPIENKESINSLVDLAKRFLKNI